MNRGFTLIEIIVALMIFSVVSVVALAALIRIVDANKKAQTIQDAVVNMSFTIESMTRELRTGSAYYCVTLGPGTDLNVNSISGQNVGQCNGVSGTSGNGVGFAFLTNRMGTNAGGCRLMNAYEVVPDPSSAGTFILKKAMQTACNQNLSFTPIIDTAAMSISNYYLKINDPDPSSNNDPTLFFLKLDGSAGNREAVKTYFTLQTAASPRIP